MTTETSALTSAEKAFRFEHVIRVRWAEADIQGVVFNGHYLTYFDIGMTEYLRELFKADADALHKVFDKLYVVKSTVEYKSPARFDEKISVRVRVARIGNSSLTFEFSILREGVALVSGENIYVYAPDGETSPVPDDLRERLQAFETSGSA
ncbi:MAG: thioesterase family protein [Burkholderiaceae bacterium]